jgi:hypothetical protein
MFSGVGHNDKLLLRGLFILITFFSLPVWMLLSLSLQVFLLSELLVFHRLLLPSEFH